MNDQIKPAPLQGKVILEPALAAQEERPPAPAQRLEGRASSVSEALDELTEVRPALTPEPRRHRLLAWGWGRSVCSPWASSAPSSSIGLPRLRSGAAPGCSPAAWWRWARPAWQGANGCVCAPLKRRDVRSRAEDLLAHQGVRAGQAFCEQLAELCSGDKGREGIAPGSPSSTRATAIGRC